MALEKIKEAQVKKVRRSGMTSFPPRAGHNEGVVNTSRSCKHNPGDRSVFQGVCISPGSYMAYILGCIR